jgi:hypothetical protein
MIHSTRYIVLVSIHSTSPPSASLQNQRALGFNHAYRKRKGFCLPVAVVNLLKTFEISIPYLTMHTFLPAEKEQTGLKANIVRLGRAQ